MKPAIKHYNRILKAQNKYRQHAVVRTLFAANNDAISIRAPINYFSVDGFIEEGRTDVLLNSNKKYLIAKINPGEEKVLLKQVEKKFVGETFSKAWRQVSLLSTVRHEGLVNLLGISQTGDNLIMIFENVNPRVSTSQLKQDLTNPNELIFLLHQVCSTFSFLHENRIIYNAPIRLDNVHVLTSNKTAKLLLSSNSKICFEYDDLATGITQDVMAFAPFLYDLCHPLEEESGRDHTEKQQLTWKNSTMQLKQFFQRLYETCTKGETNFKHMEALFKTLASSSSLRLPVLKPLPCTDLKDIATAVTMGERNKMEDYYATIKVNRKQIVSCIFDGHCGKNVAEFAHYYVPLRICEEIDAVNRKRKESPSRGDSAPHTFDFVPRVLAETDEKIKESRMSSGSTAVLACVDANAMYVDWIGDSPAYLFTKDRIESLVNVHTPEREDERARITKAGGVVERDSSGTMRATIVNRTKVHAMFSMSRTLGNVEMKHFMISTSDREARVLGKGSLLMLASDGLTHRLKAERLLQLRKEFDLAWGRKADAVKEDYLSWLAVRFVSASLNSMYDADNIAVTIIRI